MIFWAKRIASVKYSSKDICVNKDLECMVVNNPETFWARVQNTENI